ncbi:MAG: HlyD family efflux transporter periplasmic adaptor subunit [Pirellula sp.]
MIANPIRAPFEKDRSVGFPRSKSALSDSSNTRLGAPPSTGMPKPAPLKKQAKGRWFISSIIFSFLGFIAYVLWSELGQYQAYGEIEGVVIQVAPSTAGRVVTVNANEGEIVPAGKVLAVVDSIELQINLRRVRSELQLALSSLNVRMAEVRERGQQRAAEQVDRRAEYFKLLGDFHDKQARMEEASKTLENHHILRSSNSVSEAEFLAAKSIHESLELQIEDLRSAIASLEPLVKSMPDEHVDELVQAEQSRVFGIQSEITGIESLLEASSIVAPVAGRILKRKCNVGEHVDPSQPMFELLQSGSVEGIVYLPQHRATLLSIGDTISLVVVPFGKRQAFRVERLSPELSTPPTAIQSNYRAHKGLVRVHTISLDVPPGGPSKSSAHSKDSPDLSTWIGAELALPRFFFRVGSMHYSNRPLSQSTHARKEGL